MQNKDFFPCITKTELEYEKSQQDVVFFKSRFSFLQEHKGIRPACIHLLVAMSGNGKSTLTRSIISDLMLTKKKFMIILSEEPRISYLASINKIIPSEFDMNSVPFFSEIDSIDSEYDIEKSIRDFIISHGIELVVYDNITTSEWYGSPKQYEKQNESFKKLKRIATDTGVAMLLVAHVGGKISESHKELIDQNDIEGSKAPIKMAEFIYILQRFTIKEKIYSVIRIAKHRTHNVENNFFLLEYNKEYNFYQSDKALNFDSFKKIFKDRNTLGGRS